MKTRLLTAALILGLFNAFVSGDGVSLHFRLPGDPLLALIAFCGPGCILFGVLSVIQERKETA